jgi:hypothetical protein
MRDQPGLLTGLTIFSVVMLVASVFLVPAHLARMPADYFVRSASSVRRRNPVWWLLRNLFGGVLLLAGIAMLVLPGQGILTILFALEVMEFPGKHRIELAIVRRRPVLLAVNWLRKRADRPPLLTKAPTRPGESAVRTNQ